MERVASTAFEFAVKDRNPAMCMFILKCRAGWREKHEIDLNHSFKPVVISRKDGTTLELSMGQRRDIEGDRDED